MHPKGITQLWFGQGTDRILLCIPVSINCLYKTFVNSDQSGVNLTLGKQAMFFKSHSLSGLQLTSICWPSNLEHVCITCTYPVAEEMVRPISTA